jgi:hypothetical protein
MTVASFCHWARRLPPLLCRGYYDGHSSACAPAHKGAEALAEERPHVDFVLLSHLHGEHFDHVVEWRLDGSLPIVTTIDAARHLARRPQG